jgi:hypothetical protein
MNIDGHLLDEVRLDNGLVLSIYDQSRSVAGDRWRVQLLLHIPIAVKESHFEHCEDPGEAYRSFRLAVGEEIHFRQERVRNFIDQQALPSLLEELKMECLRFSLVYLGRPNFAAKCVQQHYYEWQQKQALRVVQARRTGSVD